MVTHKVRQTTNHKSRRNAHPIVCASYSTVSEDPLLDGHGEILHRLANKTCLVSRGFGRCSGTAHCRYGSRAQRSRTYRARRTLSRQSSTRWWCASGILVFLSPGDAFELRESLVDTTTTARRTHGSRRRWPAYGPTRIRTVASDIRHDCRPGTSSSWVAILRVRRSRNCARKVLPPQPA